MKRILAVIVALLLVIGWSLAAGALHVVYAGSKVIIIPKHRVGVRETFVNISNWTAEDVSNHPNVTARLIATGKSESLSHVFQLTGEELVAQLQEAIARGPTTAPAPTLIDKAKEAAHEASQVVQH